MGTFGKSLSRELGKNTGKYISNKVFGNSGWATPRRHIIDIEDKRRATEERRAEREQKRAEREAEKEARRQAAEAKRQQREIEKKEYQEGVELRRLQRKIARQEKEEEREHKAWLKEQERIAKEEEIQSNFDEHENFESYIDSIQSLHEVSIEKLDWKSLTESKSKSFSVLITEEYEKVKLTCCENESEKDELFKDAAKIVVANQQASISLLQRELKLGSNRAGRIINQLETAGIIGLSRDNKTREVLIPDEIVLDEKYGISFYHDLLDTDSFSAALYGKLKNGDLGAEQNDVPQKRPNYILESEIKSFSDKISNLLDHKTKLLQKYFNNKDGNYTKKYNELLDKFESIKKNLSFNKSDLIANEKILKNNKRKLTELNNKNRIIAFLSNKSKEIEDKKRYYEEDIQWHLNRIEELNVLIDIEKKELIEIESVLEMMREVKEIESSVFSAVKRIENLMDASSFLNRLWDKAYSLYVKNKSEVDIIENITNKKSDYYRKAFEYRPFDDFLKEYGSSANFNFFQDIIDAEIFINIEDVVPKNKTRITAAGLLSSKPFSKTERNTLIKNYVSSMTLRLAEEMFAVYPVSELIISVVYNERSSITGNFEDVVILSTNISRQIIETLNLDYVNPSEALLNFKTNIKYSNNNGLQKTERIIIPSLKKVKTKLKAEKNLDTFIRKEGINHVLVINSNMSVSNLKDLVKENFKIDIELLTKAGNIAGDNRKIKAISTKDFKQFEVKNIEEIINKTGIKIETVTGKRSQIDYNLIKIEINKSMRVKDVIDQFKKHFGKDVFVLSGKGNKVSENRRIQALTSTTIDQIFFTLDKLSKVNLKKIKKEIGLHIDY